jgi:PleD family two-component response regulator
VPVNSWSVSFVARDLSPRALGALTTISKRVSTCLQFLRLRSSFGANRTSPGKKTNRVSKRILVVQDQEDNRQIIRDMLTATDYELLEAVAINLKTTKAFGLTVLLELLSPADEVVE